MQPEWLKRYFQAQDEDGSAGDTEGSAESDVSRRDFVKTGVVAGMAAGMAAASVAGQASQADAQTPATPLGRRWWPSVWGPQDQRGANNRITPEKVRGA